MRKVFLICLISSASAIYSVATTSATVSKQEKDIDDVLINLRAEGLYETLQFMVENGVQAKQVLTVEISQETLQSFVETFVDQLDTARSDALGDMSERVSYGQLLSDWYSFFAPDHSYASILLRDALKRCYIEYAAADMLSEEYKPDDSIHATVLESMALSFDDLHELRGEKNTVTYNPTSLREATENLWRSHGYTNSVDGFVGLGEVMQTYAWNLGEPTLSLFNKKQVITLALRILQTEKLRTLAYPITRLYVERGGNPYKLNLRDVSSFYEKITLNECKQYSFEALGVVRAGPGDVLLFVGRSRKGTDNKVWMNGILD